MKTRRNTRKKVIVETESQSGHSEFDHGTIPKNTSDSLAHRERLYEEYSLDHVKQTQLINLNHIYIYL